MTESEIYSNPQRLLELAEELHGFTTGLTAELETLQSDLQRLGTTWQDEEYTKFKRVFERVKTGLAELSEEIRKREPELNEDAQALLAYLKKGI